MTDEARRVREEEIKARLKTFEGTVLRTERDFLRDGNLAPIEQILIGSGLFSSLDQQMIDAGEYLDRVSKGDRAALVRLTTPVFLMKKEKSLEEIRANRDSEIDKKTRTGWLCIADHESQKETPGQGMVFWVEPSPLSEEGTVETEWKIWILDGKRQKVKNPNLISKLVLDKKNASWFTLEEATGEAYRLLKLKRLRN